MTTTKEVSYGRQNLSDLTVHYDDGSEQMSVHCHAAILAHSSQYFDALVDGLSFGSPRSDQCSLSSRCNEPSRRCVALPDKQLGDKDVSCAELQKFFDVLYEPAHIFESALEMKSHLAAWRENLQPGDIVQFAPDANEYYYRPHPRHKQNMSWTMGTVSSIKNGRAEITYQPENGLKLNSEKTQSNVILDRLQPFGEDSRVEYSYVLSDFLIEHRSTITIASYFQCDHLLDLYEAHCTTLHCDALDRFQSEPLWVLLMLANKCNWPHLIEALIPLLATDINCDKRPDSFRRTAPTWNEVYIPLSSDVKARLLAKAIGAQQ